MSTELAAPTVFNPTAEEAYWRDAYRSEPYYRADRTYEDYGPAYRVGYTGPVRREGEFAQREGDLAHDFEQIRGHSRLNWDEAREAARAAWQRVAGRGPAH